MKEIKCPKCKNNIELNEDSKEIVCKYCGTNYTTSSNTSNTSKVIGIVVVLIAISISIITYIIVKRVLYTYPYGTYNSEEVDTAIQDNNHGDVNTSNINKETKLSDIKRINSKVNIYMFYGSTCPHCEEAFGFFDSIENNYGDLFNLYAFEVWNNPDNMNLFEKFAAASGEEANGVPYIVIGDKTFTGFAEFMEEQIINAIKDGSKKTNDIYFDKVSKISDEIDG